MYIICEAKKLAERHFRLSLGLDFPRDNLTSWRLGKWCVEFKRRKMYALLKLAFYSFGSDFKQRLVSRF